MQRHNVVRTVPIQIETGDSEDASDSIIECRVGQFGGVSPATITNYLPIVRTLLTERFGAREVVLETLGVSARMTIASSTTANPVTGASTDKWFVATTSGASAEARSTCVTPSVVKK